MRNRAKCKLCQSIIESFHASDLVLCKCGEISVEGGDALRCCAKDWNNFLRVDDEGNEIIVKIKGIENKIDNNKDDENNKPSKQELLKILENMIKSIEQLPQNGMLSPITHYDHLSGLILIYEIFKKF